MPTSEYFYQNTLGAEAWPKSSALAEAGMASGNKIWLEAISKASESLPVHQDLESKAILSNCLNTIQSCCTTRASQIPRCPVGDKGRQCKPELELRTVPSLGTALACGASSRHHQLEREKVMDFREGLQLLLVESFVTALGDPVPAAGRQEGVHCISRFFLFLY